MRGTAIAIVVGALVLAACGAAAAPAAGGTVAVAMQEWAIVPAQTSATAGKVTFDVKNVGPDNPHEFVVIKTDLAPDKLPTGADGKVDEEAAGITFVGEIEEFKPGETKSATFNLTPGKYVLICNIVEDKPDGGKEAHYKMGMLAPFTVN